MVSARYKEEMEDYRFGMTLRMGQGCVVQLMIELESQ